MVGAVLASDGTLLPDEEHDRGVAAGVAALEGSVTRLDDAVAVGGDTPSESALLQPATSTVIAESATATPPRRAMFLVERISAGSLLLPARCKSAARG